MKHISNTIFATDHGKEKYDTTLKELGIKDNDKLEKEVMDMGYFADAIEERGMIQGRIQGMDTESERSVKLFTLLRDQGKKDELEKAIFDVEFRKKLYDLYDVK